MQRMIKACCLSFIVLHVLCGTGMALAKIPDPLFAELKAYRKVACEKKTDPHAWFLYAMSCAYTGRVEEGFEALKRVDQLDPSFAKKIIPIYERRINSPYSDWKDRFRYAFAVYSLSVDHKKKGISREEAEKHKEEAFKQFESILGVIGKNEFVTAWAYGYMGAIRGEQERYEEAIGYLKEGIGIVPDGTALHFALGYAYMKTGDWTGVMAQTLKVGRLKAEEKKFYRNEDDISVVYEE